jgi:beta-galactosidase
MKKSLFATYPCRILSRCTYNSKRSFVFSLCLFVLSSLCVFSTHAQGIRFNHDFSPATGLITPSEKPYREEICLNGSWDFQPIAVPANWQKGTGVPPELTAPDAGKWESTKIRIPSPWNVNEWGGGSKVGKGTNLPYAPSSVYYPSYPQSWAGVRMAWLKRSFIIPANWNTQQKRFLLHFEAVAGECVVLVNGREVTRNIDAYLPFEADITDQLHKDQPNELMVGIRHRRLFDKFHAEYKRMNATYPPGSNTHDLAGIWQDVFLEAVPATRVQNIFVKPDVAKDELVLEVQVINQSNKAKKLTLDGTVKAWINKAGKDVLSAPEINWTLGNTVLSVPPVTVTIAAGATQTITLRSKVQGKLKYWSPVTPNLYTVLVDTKENGRLLDRKAERFGWRSIIIKGKDFLLNGEKIQAVGDIQHPFGPYICSRRFAWAWYQMIKDVGGNAVRPHAQPWPRVYYDLADEMGLLVLDEGALFGSSIALNLEEDITWQRSAEHIDRLVLRDRNHPSVIGYSIGNEMFAIALLNKPPVEVARQWDDKIVELAKRPLALDPTRAFITSDGDKDMDNRLPVWSKHFGHGLQLKQLPAIDKPLIIGESGATYYGKPRELFPFIGLKAYGSYAQRSEALAIDVSQNVVQMAKPLLAYYSPSELCWFGIEHMNLGYSDYSRLPDNNDGIFAGLPYEEGKPGYQFERIPPYVTTFNPGLDPALPLYKPLPMFNAMKAALAKNGPQPSPWDHYQDTAWQKPVYPATIYTTAVVAGKTDNALRALLDTLGINKSSNAQSRLVMIDGEQVTTADLQQADASLQTIKQQGGLVWVMLSEGQPTRDISQWLPASLALSPFTTTALQSNNKDSIGKCFNLRDLYFSEMNGDKQIIKQGFTGEALNKATIVLEAASTDWQLFNEAPENRKCAQVVLYEHLQKPRSAAFITLPYGKGMIALSTVDYHILNAETRIFWKKLCAALAIQYKDKEAIDKNNKKHDLLMDGPVNN